MIVCCLPLSTSVAQPDLADAEVLAGAEAVQSLGRLRSVVLKDVPFGDAVSDLQTNLRYAIVVEHMIDPGQPVTLVTGLVKSDELLRQLAASIGADVSFTENYAVVGRPESVGRLRTVLELRRTELRSMRTKLDADVYRRCFEPAGSGWPNLMRPNEYVRQQIQSVGLTVSEEQLLPHDLWKAQSLPAVEFVERMTVVLNQYDLTFQIDDVGRVIFIPVEERPSVRRRVRVPSDRRMAVESLLKAEPSVQAAWVGSRVTLDGTVEMIEAVEGVIRNESTTATKEDLRTQGFTMSIPHGSTVLQVVESFRAQGVEIRIQGASDAVRQHFLQRKVQLNAERMLGAEFFPTLLKENGVTVRVEADYVLIQL